MRGSGTRCFRSWLSFKAGAVQRLVNQGMILGEDGQKMSKRRGNVDRPDEVIEQYGADAFRCYEMFMGPLEQMKPWSMKGVEGVSRFLARVWRLIMEENQAGEWVLSGEVQEAEPTKAQLKVLHATIKKVTEDIETLSFNTAISQMMILVNALHQRGRRQTRFRAAHVAHSAQSIRARISLRSCGKFWLKSSRRGSDITAQAWPEHDEQFLVEDEIEIVLQVNGKVRDRITVALDASEAELRAAALANAKVQNAVGRPDDSQGRRHPQKACQRRRDLR